jgi:hypothetical protein
MATPPRITDAERDAAITRIVERHDRIDDVEPHGCVSEKPHELSVMAA